VIDSTRKELSKHGGNGWTRVALRTLAIMLILSSASIAQTQFSVLYTFHGNPDGALPTGLTYASGMFYGTTTDGGKCTFLSCGTVYRVDTAGDERVLYRFKEHGDGGNPNSGLLRDADGTLYGTTYGGGTYHGGVVFRLESTGKETVLHNFGHAMDGALPTAGVIRDEEGNLFGTTYDGGSHWDGTVFKVNSGDKETIFYDFTGNADGSGPIPTLIRDAEGNLYGSTHGGGNASCELGCGVLFKLDSTGRETVLYSFTGGDDGDYPGGIVRDSAGNIYGAATAGGCSGNGTVFRLDVKGNYKVLHCFAGEPKDGSGPGGLILVGGELYGTTIGGGGGDCYDDNHKKIGCGIAFRLDMNGNERVLHRFTGGKGGSRPSGLATDDGHDFYGTTGIGGDTTCKAPYGCGTVFRLSVK